MKKDNGYAWIILLASSIIIFTVDAVFYSFSIFFPDINEYFHASKAETAMLGAVMQGIPQFSAPLISSVLRKLNHRLCMMLSGLLMCTAFTSNYWVNSLSLMIVIYLFLLPFAIMSAYTICISTLSRCFSRYRWQAFAVMSSSGALGVLCAPLLIQYLIHTFTWRGASVVIGALSLHICVAAALMGPSFSIQHDETALEETATVFADMITSVYSVNPNYDPTNASRLSEKPDTRLLENKNLELEELETVILPKKAPNVFRKGIDKVQRIFHWELFKVPGFGLFVVSGFFNTMGESILWSFIPDAAQEAGCSDYEGAILATSWGMSCMLAYPFMGLISSKTNPFVTAAACHAAMGVCMILMPQFFGHFQYSLVLVSLFGVCLASRAGTMIQALLLFVSDENTSSAFSFQQLFCGMGILIATPNAGALFDVYKSYGPAFYLAATSVFVASVMKCAAFYQYRKTAKSTNE